MLYLFAFAIQLSLAIFIIYLCLAFITGAPFVPSTDGAAGSMIGIASLKKGERVYDLGSGNGKILFLAAAKGVIATGYEMNPFLVLFTRLRTYFSPYRKTVRVYWKNFWKADLKNADVVFLYLLPWRMDDFRVQFLQTLQPGTRVISNSFLIPGWTPEREDSKHHIFLYIVK